MKILGKRILVKLPQDNVKKLTGTGIVRKNDSKIVTSVDKDKAHTKGIVVAVGTGNRLSSNAIYNCQCKVGDEVIFTEYAGIPIQKGDINLLCLNEADVLVIKRNDKLITLNDYILCDPIKSENKVGKLVVSNKENETFTAKVLAVGEGRILDDGSRDFMEMKINDTVCYHYKKGNKIFIEGKEYIVLQRKDVLMILNE